MKGWDWGSWIGVQILWWYAVKGWVYDAHDDDCDGQID